MDALVPVSTLQGVSHSPSSCRVAYRQPEPNPTLPSSIQLLLDFVAAAAPATAATFAPSYCYYTLHAKYSPIQPYFRPTHSPFGSFLFHFFLFLSSFPESTKIYFIPYFPSCSRNSLMNLLIMSYKLSVTKSYINKKIVQ